MEEQAWPSPRGRLPSVSQHEPHLYWPACCQAALGSATSNSHALLAVSFLSASCQLETYRDIRRKEEEGIFVGILIPGHEGPAGAGAHLFSLCFFHSPVFVLLKSLESLMQNVLTLKVKHSGPAP